MRKVISTMLGVVVLLGILVSAPASTMQYRDPGGTAARRWLANPIIVSFSSSLNTPPPNVKAGSDLIGAVRRALQHWSRVVNIQFVEATSAKQSISAPNQADGVNLITVSDENAGVFGLSDSPGRTRVFYDSGGAIVEADIALNSNQKFSSDGTPGTYDLESTFTHEVGHLLGLEHSAVIGATMQPRQAKNGLYALPAFTQRTLSEDDCAGARALYGSRANSGLISGRLIANGAAASSRAVFGAQVFAENAKTGRVIASDVSLASGDYHIEGLTPGTYRVVSQDLNGLVAAADIAPGGSYAQLKSTYPLFKTTESSTIISARSAEATSDLQVSPDLYVTANPTIGLQPRVIGLNGELSTVALPLEAGKTATIYLGGEGINQLPVSGIRSTSPYIKVDPTTIAPEDFDTPYPVISFDVTVAPNTEAGDYSLRLQSTNGEVAYLAGALTIDPGVRSSSFANAADDPDFFVRQHYRDFLGREPDAAGLDFWTSKLIQCGADASCLRDQRIQMSAAFFAATEFQQTGGFVYRVYQAALSRSPSFAEFSADRGAVMAGGNLESDRQSFAADFAQRPEFINRYSTSLTGGQFVDRLIAAVRQSSEVDLSSQRDALLGLFDGTGAGRAAILRRVAEEPAFIQAEYNRAFVLMQYFGYLRRDADRDGYQFWLNLLNQKLPDQANRNQAMVCAFVSSAEYQLRFGITATRSNAECGQ